MDIIGAAYRAAIEEFRRTNGSPPPMAPVEASSDDSDSDKSGSWHPEMGDDDAGKEAMEVDEPKAPAATAGGEDEKKDDPAAMMEQDSGPGSGPEEESGSGSGDEESGSGSGGEDSPSSEEAPGPDTE